ncbi:hypothetical protein [Burkholderia seminalis]|uniref:hypothetical protein n=1 Tax=Burkholderia seminalis TaxID=488731 RepID=UPI0026509A98|nr:hypothetical protein [Burkholderia seminalis]MDN7848116.1 hypothetical protein [Burkholderia seminalis]
MSGTSQLTGSGWLAYGAPRTDDKPYGVPYYSGKPQDQVGENGDVTIDPVTLTVYKKTAGAWAALAPSGAVTVQNSAGTVTRNLTATNGVVTLAATDAIVANGATMTLQKSDGTTSAGNATLNSPATAIVAAGALTAVKAAA